MNKKLFLIYPPKADISSTNLEHMPLSLLYLAGAVRDICDEIVIFDGNLKGNDLNRLQYMLMQVSPSVVGINCLFSGHIILVKEISEIVNKVLPKSKVVIGGIHPTIFATDIMKNCDTIDAVVLGEGDDVFPKLLNYYWGDAEFETLHSVEIRKDGKLFSVPRKSYIEELEKIPMPGYEFIDFNSYKINVKNWYNPKNINIYPVPVPLVTSRSCPNQCNFCSMNLVMGRKCRMRKSKHVFDEIYFLNKQYGINYFKLMDDNFTLDKKRTLEICSMIIDNNLDIYLELPGGVMARTLDEEVIEAMAQAGFIRVGFAVESGSDYIRNNVMRKNVSKQKMYKMLELFKKYKILTTAFFLIGMPEETEDTLHETIDFINTAVFDWFSLAVLVPFPGTPLFEQCIRDNLFTEEIKLETLWLDSATMFNMQDYNVLVKPYAMTSQQVKSYEQEIRALLNKKCSGWINHMNTNK